MRHFGTLGIAATIGLLLALGAYSQQGGGQQSGNSNQSNGQAQPVGSVTGQVVSSTTGEPLRKVSLTLQPQGRGGSPAAATSDNSGNFRFTNLDAGTYTLTGERSGYVRGSYGADRPGQQARQITVASGQTTGGIQLKLTPHSVITGRVYDLDGDPVQGAQVQVMRYSYPRGQKQLTNVAQVTTNDLGEYRVAGLPPGRYFVSATDRRALSNLRGRGGRGSNRDEPNPELYVTTYHPRTLDARASTAIELVPGSEAHGIDIGLLKGRTYTVSGMIEGLPEATPLNPRPNDQKGKGKQGGPPGRGIQVMLLPRTNTAGGNAVDQLLRANAQVSGDGSFTIRNVRPGAYYLMADSRGPQQSRLSARVAVDVAGDDVTNVRARLSPPNAISGVVMPEEADSTLSLKQVRLNFVSAAPGGRGGQSQRVEVADDGKFQDTLSSDTYRIEAQGAPSGYYLKSVRLSGRELPDNVLDLNFSGAKLDVVLANDSASITGTVQRANGDVVQNAKVTVIPANSSRRDLYQSANSGSDGTFTVSNVPPGTYKVFAWEEVEQNAWQDPDFRRPFETLGTSATIRDSAGPNLVLRVIGKEQMLSVQ